MEKLFSAPRLIKVKYPLWVDRLEDRQKRQEEKGEEVTLPHPKEIL